MVVVVTGGGRRLGLAASLSLAGGIVAGVTLLLAVVFSVISWPPWADYQLDRAAVASRATLLADPVVVSSRRGAPNRVRLEVRIESGPASGRTIDLTASLVAGLCAGETIEIEYLADQPALARVERGRYGIFGLAAVVPLLLIAALGMVLAATGLVARLVGARR